MSQYDVGFPTQDVRLRNWPSGRLNLLRLAVQRLESGVSQTLGARVEQSQRRKVSDQVPFPLSLDVRPGFRQAEVNIGKAPGLLGGHPFRQLLFYELQHDATPGFPNPTIIETTYTHIALAGLALGETRSFRARVVSTRNEVSRWTATKTVTVAQSAIQQTALPDKSVRLEQPVGVFQTILSATYTPVEAQATLLGHIAVCGPHFDTVRRQGAVNLKTLYGGPAFVQFRWRVGSLNAASLNYDLRPVGERAMLSVRPGFSAASDLSSVRNPLAFGALPTPWFKLTAGVEAKVVLEAAKCPGSEWLGSQRERATQITDPVVFLRNGQVIEVLEDL